PRQNGTFEGLSFSPDFRRLYVSMEEPLFEDGFKAGTGDSSAFIRILAYETESRRAVHEYAYRIEPVAVIPDPPTGFRVNGVVDILFLNEKKLLVLERSYSTGYRSSTIRLFMADLSKATDVSGLSSLARHKDFTPVSKQLLLSLNDFGMEIDNVEGMCLGPRMPNGNRTLIMVSDNNFSEEQATQFFLFELPGF
ncbi:MAG TPA: esterase-like activity of phytase family protein, partial [Flavisolibacter sp.]|nr:esterase-like activity of phytase family protein [Flavisolibacter sp.]